MPLVRSRYAFALIVFYFSASIFYIYFMSTHAPLGLSWRPWHSNFVRSAAENFVLHPDLTRLGIGLAGTDFSNKPYSSVLLHRTYIVPSFQFIIHSFFLRVLPASSFSIVGFLFDYVITCLIGVFCSILGASSISLNCSIIDRRRLPCFIYSAISIYILFLPSVWTYRSLLAPWQEQSFLFFILIALCLMSDDVFHIFKFLNLLHLDRFKLASLFLLLAVLNQYHFAFMLFIYIASIAVANALGFEEALLYLPPLIRIRKRYLFILLLFVIPILLSAAQSFVLSNIYSITPENSTAIDRMGLEAASSIHYGGYLSILQFLGGNRMSVCISGISSFSQVNSLIAPFNCILSILSLFLASGFILALVIRQISNPKSLYCWLFSFLTVPFLLMAAIFQQSFAVHLQGYSIIFSAIFSLGFTSFVAPFLFRLKSFPISLPIATLLIYLPIIYTFIKVSYLTPVGG